MAARVRRAPSSGVGRMSPGNRPWPGIASPDCHDCSWAWNWDRKRMEIKYLNSMCTVRAHRMAGVEAAGSE